MEPFRSVVQSLFFPATPLAPRYRFTSVSVIVMLAALALLLAGQAVRTADTAGTLTARNQELDEELQATRAELAGLRSRLDSDFRITLDRKHYTMTLLRGDEVIRRMPCAIGRGDYSRNGRAFDFNTPIGRRRVLAKDENPIWYRPDWAWLERGDTLPEHLTREQRAVEGMLGKFRLDLGEGIAIHGAPGPVAPGNYTHGCIRLGADDLEMVYRLVEIGAPVEIQ